MQKIIFRIRLEVSEIKQRNSSALLYYYKYIRIYSEIQNGKILSLLGQELL